MVECAQFTQPRAVNKAQWKIIFVISNTLSFVFEFLVNDLLKIEFEIGVIFHCAVLGLSVLPLFTDGALTGVTDLDFPFEVQCHGWWW